MDRIKKLIRPEQIRELSLLVIIVLVVLLFGSQIDNYYSFRTFSRISSSVMIIAIVAVGQTLVLLTRNYDLSVGSIVGFTAYFVGQQASLNNDLSPLVLVLIAIGFGAALGVINGVIVAYGRVPSIVVTLGTLAIYRGVLVEYSGGSSIVVRDLPDWLINLPRVTVFTIGEVEIRLLVLLAVMVVVVFQLVLSYLSFGRRLYAIGSNPDAAEGAGLPKQRLIFTAYVLCGALSGLGGFVFLARFGTISITSAQGLELQVIAAAVVGGVNAFGGSGTMVGALLGAVLIGTLEQSLIRMRINEFWKDAILGISILLAVATDTLIMDRLRHLWARSELESIAEETQLQREGSRAS